MSQQIFVASFLNVRLSEFWRYISEKKKKAITTTKTCQDPCFQCAEANM
jgi:hypothetical protein